MDTVAAVVDGMAAVVDGAAAVVGGAEAGEELEVVDDVDGGAATDDVLDVVDGAVDPGTPAMVVATGTDGCSVEIVSCSGVSPHAPTPSNRAMQSAPAWKR